MRSTGVLYEYGEYEMIAMTVVTDMSIRVFANVGCKQVIVISNK